MPTTDGALREIPGGFYPHTPFVQSGGRLWVAHHDTVAVVPESPFPKGWLAVQSVPSEVTGGYRPACRSLQRVAATCAQSCRSWPSGGVMNAGAKAITSGFPGATITGVIPW